MSWLDALPKAPTWWPDSREEQKGFLKPRKEAKPASSPPGCLLAAPEQRAGWLQPEEAGQGPEGRWRLGSMANQGGGLSPSERWRAGSTRMRGMCPKRGMAPSGLGKRPGGERSRLMGTMGQTQ